MRCYVYLNKKTLSGEDYDIGTILKKAKKGDAESIYILENMKAISYGQRGVALNEKQEIADCVFNYAVVLSPTKKSETNTGFPLYIYENEGKEKEKIVLRNLTKIFEAEDKESFFKQIIALHNVIRQDTLVYEEKKEKIKQ